MKSRSAQIVIAMDENEPVTVQQRIDVHVWLNTA
jgi:hypothetical protein